ncbi:hypothetical protein SME22J_32330 [Serratia marcescens]|nr:hypothetical protein SME22J_32330 [Serratia marcescens]BEO43814.1 hypothetical protein SMQE13_31650 [Serratia marcescens]
MAMISVRQLQLRLYTDLKVSYERCGVGDFNVSWGETSRGK